MSFAVFVRELCWSESRAVFVGCLMLFFAVLIGDDVGNCFRLSTDRELWSVWKSGTSPSGRLTYDRVIGLFHAMELYPSKSQSKTVTL